MTNLKLLLTIVILCFTTSFAFSEGRPNFVIVFADDMGYGDAGCYGHPTIKTPNIDRMAAEGMRMTQFYSASSVCSPSRASLLTGRLPIRCQVPVVLFPHNDKGLPKDEITIAKFLKKEGYETACIGKWHLGHKKGYLPADHGFNSYFGIPYSNDMYIDSMALLAKNILLREGVTVKGIRANEYFRHNPRYVPLMQQEEVIEFPVNQSTLTKRYTEKAIEFIKSHKSLPFFLYLAHTMPHTPLHVSNSFKDKSLRGLYGDVIGELDWSVGQILKTLKEVGLDKNTIVIFTSDNGPWLKQNLNGGSSGLLRGAKFTTWEGGFREPGIIWWPEKIPAGSVNRELASTLDILPTILDFADVNLPLDRVIDGYSLKDMLVNNAKSPRSSMFYYRGKKLQAIRLGQWKAHYISSDEYGKNSVDNNPPLLYNVEMDPGENFNVAKNNPGILEKINKIKLEHENSLNSH